MPKHNAYFSDEGVYERMLEFCKKSPTHNASNVIQEGVRMFLDQQEKEHKVLVATGIREEAQKDA